MSQIVIENPIINSLFEKSQQYFRFNDRLSVLREHYASA